MHLCRYLCTDPVNKEGCNEMRSGVRVFGMGLTDRGSGEKKNKPTRINNAPKKTSLWS